MSKQNVSVIIYTTPTCPYCHLAKEYFDEKGIKYTEHDVAGDQNKAKEMVEKSGQMGVPVIMIDDQVIVGFNKPEIERLIKS